MRDRLMGWWWVGVWALLLGCGNACAEPAAAGDDCLDRTLQPASAPMPPVRLRELSYRCMALANGQQVLVGEGGAREAPTVLLVHGLGHNAHRDWAPTLAALLPQFHVVALDLPGFGSSPAAPGGYAFATLAGVLAQVLDRTAPGQRVQVVGHSLGAAVSLHFAHARPERVGRLVLVDAAGILLKNVFVRHVTGVRTRQVGFDPVDRVIRGLSERLNGLQRVLFGDMDERFDFSRWLAQNPGVRTALLGRYTQVEAGLGLVEHDFTAALRETAAPTTVIWGADDPIAPLRTGRLLAARMPDAQLQVIAGAGHTPMLERPQEFNRLLLAALSAPRVPGVPPMPRGEGHAALAAEASQGDVTCRQQAQARYSGRYERLTLEHCSGVSIEGARIGQLVMKSSSATLDDSVIRSDDVALVMEDSELIATGLQINGRVGIRASGSRLDLAGTSLRAREAGLEMPTPSRLWLSVCDWQAIDHQGDAHFVWPPSGVPPR